ncbi:S-adenosyl-L-methionine-dependent methyltransferase [Annulohypoxylon bovei var. microspora]|nr:S-adenosyl-L-methionine-dependent methyltransferase [Annulohypoxylon bovei var. microspora]
MTSSETIPRIVQLAGAISTSVTNIQKTLCAKGIPPPSFDEDAPFNIPLEITKDHDIVLDATAELHDLLLEPLNLIHRHGGHNNLLCLGAIAEFKIADMVPPNGRASFGEIANQTPMTEQMTARILRHAMTMRVFREPEPGMVAHTAASKVLSHSAANDWLQSGTREMWPAATKTLEALQKWPASQEPNETGYSLSNNGTETVYDVFAKDAERAERWARGMEIFSRRPQFNLLYITNNYDWKSLGQAQVIDIGSQGQVSMTLAREFSNLELIAQDMGKVVDAAFPEELRNRVQFITHDLFAQQPYKGADVYSLRWVFHTWSDKYCTQILRALIPALKPGARVIVQETLMPEPGAIATWKEKNMRATDLNMAAAFNAQERTVTELKSLFERVDSGFELRNVIEPAGSAFGILEFVWKGSVKQDTT